MSNGGKDIKRCPKCRGTMVNLGLNANVGLWECINCGYKESKELLEDGLVK